MAANVTARGTANGFSVDIQHPIADRGNADLIAECIQVILDCAEANNCLTDRLNISYQCIANISKHEEASRCLSTCFGCAP